MSDAICCKLVDYLDELTDEELKRFKLHLENYPLDEGYKPIRHAKTEYADRCDLAGLMIAAYEENKALQMSINIFNRIHRKDLSEKVQREMPKVEVTLDPKTAFPTLILSEDRKSVHLGNIAQSLPDNPERFNFFPCVLGAEGVDSGTLEWVVEVGKAKGWAIGAARESIQRKWYQHLTVAQGFWVLQLNHGEYMASTSPPTTLSLWKSPRRIKIQLEYDFQNLSFYDADSGESIFTFNYPFTEKMFPFFQVWDKEIPLKICSSDSEGANCQL